MQIVGEARSIAWYSIQIAGAEGFSGRNRRDADWEATVPMQLQRGGRLEVDRLMQLLGSLFRSPDYTKTQT